jgi:hypothetical protein
MLDNDNLSSRRECKEVENGEFVGCLEDARPCLGAHAAPPRDVQSWRLA